MILRSSSELGRTVTVSYRIKATNAETYARPRSFASSMYERKVQAREADSAAAAIEVKE